MRVQIKKNNQGGLSVIALEGRNQGITVLLAQRVGISEARVFGTRLEGNLHAVWGATITTKTDMMPRDLGVGGVFPMDVECEARLINGVWETQTGEPMVRAPYAIIDSDDTINFRGESYWNDLLAETC